MLRLLPGLELRAGTRVDSNSYLVNNDWLSLGAAVSVNLTELFTGPAAIDAEQAGRDLAAARREALSMAVLAQLYVALAGFEEARARHATVDRIAEIEHRIVEALRSSGRLGAVDRLQTLRGEIDVLLAVPGAGSQPGRGRRQFRADLPCSGRGYLAGRTGATHAGECRRIDRRHRGGLEPR